MHIVSFLLVSEFLYSRSIEFSSTWVILKATAERSPALRLGRFWSPPSTWQS